MWKKWAIVAFVYLLIVMTGYGIYAAIEGPNANPSHQMEMK
ncbi:hypothetical protein [Bacillus sp. EB600]|nr:hypothetical protein [Bacillus sp. EB600]